jgi:hypothetical protein
MTVRKAELLKRNPPDLIQSDECSTPGLHLTERPGLWIKIRIGSGITNFVYSDPESRSRSKWKEKEVNEEKSCVCEQNFNF